MEKLYQERLNRILTTASHQEPDCVPFLHMAETWNLSYAGVKAADVKVICQKEFESFCKPYEVLDFDGVVILLPYKRNEYLWCTWRRCIFLFQRWCNHSA